MCIFVVSSMLASFELECIVNWNTQY